MDKLPKRLWAEARARLRELYEAPTREDCTRRREVYCEQLRSHGQEAAAACLERDWDDFTTFYDFPQEHWLHLRTTNPIESVFDGVRLRTNAARRMHVRENALYLVFKLVHRIPLDHGVASSLGPLARAVVCFAGWKVTPSPSWL